jgi:hypothetical protein
MQLQNVDDIQLCQFVSAIHGTHRDEVRDVDKTVDNHHIESLPLGVLGSLLMKSILMSSHFHSGMDNGWSNPLGFWCSTFSHWHISHCVTNLAISPFIPLHQYLSRISTYILVAPGWME